MNTYKITKLEYSDYYNGFLQLLEQLTTVSANEITYEEFVQHYDKLKSEVFVIRNEPSNRIIATASIFIEEKFIHKLSSVGHIEDVVVDVDYRKKGLGKMLIDYLIDYAKTKKSYKVILNCSSENAEFYTKCGFSKKNIEMSIYN